MTTPATPFRSPHTGASPATSSSTRSPKPLKHTGFPASVLTDNGLVYTTRFAGGRGRPQPPRDPARRPRDRTETLPTEPPHHLRKGRTLPPDPQTWLDRPTPATIAELQDPTRRLRRRIQPPATPPIPRPAHPAGGLQPACPKPPPTGSDAGIHYRIRHDSIDKRGAVSLRRAGRCTTSASAEPTPEPRRAAHRRPRHPRHRHPHRRTPPPPHPRPHPRLPDPRNEQDRTRNAGSVLADVLPHHMAERVGFEPTEGLPPHLLSREARSARLRHLSSCRPLYSAPHAGPPPGDPGACPVPDLLSQPRALKKAASDIAFSAIRSAHTPVTGRTPWQPATPTRLTDESVHVNELTIATLPVLTLRSGVVLPQMVLTIALETEEATHRGRRGAVAGTDVLLVPKIGDTHASVGTVAAIDSAGELPGGTRAVFLRGLHRARLGVPRPATGSAVGRGARDRRSRGHRGAPPARSGVQGRAGGRPGASSGTADRGVRPQRRGPRRPGRHRGLQPGCVSRGQGRTSGDTRSHRTAAQGAGLGSRHARRARAQGPGPIRGVREPRTTPT